MKHSLRLLPGQLVELTVREGDYRGRYRTHVDEVGEKVISINAPYYQGQVIPLREGTPVEVVFWDKVSAYMFKALIMQRIAVPVPLFILELPDQTERIQRRNFVRVEAFYPIVFRTVTRDGLSDPKQGHLLDLSGGGLRFQTAVKLQNGDLLDMRLELPMETIHSSGRVCRVEPIEDTDRYAISVTFNDITERERDRVVRCVFELQRVMRKKGLV